jgi:hypothetical protein
MVSCSQVTGKAVMLDEIINYVQSLQRQIEVSTQSVASPLKLLVQNRVKCLDCDLIYLTMSMHSSCR